MTCVCVLFMTCVPDEANEMFFSAELWRFDTSTLGWEEVVNTMDNGVGPSGRYDHAMTSVGLDLWMYGGYVAGERDTCSAHTMLCCTEGERVTLCTFSDCVSCGVLLL